MEKSQMRRVRQASIAALAAPLRLLVTLKPKKLKNAMLMMLPAVDTCQQEVMSLCSLSVKADTLTNADAWMK